MTDITLDPKDQRGHKEIGVSLDPLPHYVSPEPFDPMSVEAMTASQERYNQASQWRLMWWRLLRHRVGFFVHGCVWGSACLLPLPAGDHVHLAVLVVMLMTVAISSFTVTTFDMAAGAKARYVAEQKFNLDWRSFPNEDPNEVAKRIDTARAGARRSTPTARYSGRARHGRPWSVHGREPRRRNSRRDRSKAARSAASAIWRSVRS